jgi:hypothetical protein
MARLLLRQRKILRREVRPKKRAKSASVPE